MLDYQRCFIPSDTGSTKPEVVLKRLKFNCRNFLKFFDDQRCFILSNVVEKHRKHYTGNDFKKTEI